MAIWNFSFDLDSSIYQAAMARAQGEGKTLEQALMALLTEYASGQQQPTTYIVKRGDSLSRIARQIYGDARKYPLIQQANNLSDPGRIWVGQVLVIPPLVGIEPGQPDEPPTFPPSPQPEPKPEPKPEPPAPRVDPCAAISGENYGTLPIVGSPTDRPADQHGDINLALRGYSPTESTLGLIDMAGPTDSRAPQLAGLFADNRTGVFTRVYRVNHWDWGSNSRGGPITDFNVTLAGLQVKPGETIHVPKAGYDIGQGYQVLVLYASQERITLKYTGEDTAATGYVIHVEGVCCEPQPIGALSADERRRAASTACPPRRPGLWPGPGG